ncbi:MAG: TetR/AcrR family transcriptional regulator [Pseudomonadota bacterium]
MPRLSNAREQIIERARSLLTERGFDGFSYRDISEHLGIRNAAIHYHFPSKTDLGLALIQDVAQEMLDQIEEARKTLTPAQQLNGYFEYEIQHCAHFDLCPVGALSTSWEVLSDDMRGAVASFWQAVLDWLAEVLEKGRETGEIRFYGEPIDKARLIIAAVSGARQQARIDGGNLVAQVAEQFRREMFAEAEN